MKGWREGFASAIVGPDGASSAQIRKLSVVFGHHADGVSASRHQQAAVRGVLSCHWPSISGLVQRCMIQIGSKIRVTLSGHPVIDRQARRGTAICPGGFESVT
jgi:hypothetical protein